MDKAQPFSLVLKRLRLAAGLTHEALAERASLAARTISDLERGVARAPRADTLALLIDALDLTVDQRAMLQLSARQGVASFHDKLLSEFSPTNVPLQLTSFIGREQETLVVRNLVREIDTRLVTLTGSGGVGKTRLALHVGMQLNQMFVDGVFAVELAPVEDRTGVCQAIGTALGIGGGNLVTPNRIAEQIDQKAMLLILDNFEHVLDAAPLVAGLLRGCPHMKALATSRARLRISGEQEFPVLPFPIPDLVRLPPIEQIVEYPSVKLFVERASRVRPDFAVTLENAAIIAAICARLDGLPLALELAAARTKTVPPRELLQRLQAATNAPSMRLLAGGPRDVPERQQTLRNTIAWSYGLLSESDRVLFRRLAVFVGGCTLGEVKAICAWSDETVGAPVSESETAHPQLRDIDDSLASLVDQSLVYQGEGADGKLRYLMLETIREFAWEELARSGEEEAVRRQHAQFFLAMVESTGALLFAAAPKRAILDAEQGNVRAALSWLVQQG